MKSFDGFSKPTKDIQVKTAFGGYLSVLSVITMGLLFVNELAYFLTVETRDTMSIDRNQESKYTSVSFDVTLFGAPCSVLHVNLLDTKKLHVLHVHHEIYKQRLSKSGEPIGLRVRESLQSVAQNAGELTEAATRTPHENTLARNTADLRCDSCFQGHIDEDDCCSTCDSVRKAFKESGVADPSDYVFAQCADELYKKAPPRRGEYCRLQANLQVRKVAATLQIGVGSVLEHGHLPENKDEARAKFVQNLAFGHVINELAFGPDFPGLSRVLDGRKHTQHEEAHTEHFQYDVHVIPTTFQSVDGDVIVSNQYSVTEYMKSIEMGNREEHLGASGIFMSYDFTPFEVKVSESRKHFSHFMTECCAIVGGVFAFTGMLDNFAYRFVKGVAGGRRNPRDTL